MTVDSAFKTSNLGLFFPCNRHNIASSPWGSIVVVVVVVVGLGRCTVEVVGVAGVVVVVSSGLHFTSATVGVAWARHWRSIVPRGISGKRVGAILQIGRASCRERV